MTRIGFIRVIRVNLRQKKLESYMRKLLLVGAICVALAVSVNAQQLSLDAMIDRDIASWITTYKNLHTTPELSHREEKTSAFVAGELRKLGFTVTERIGKYENAQWRGWRFEEWCWSNRPRANGARCVAG